MRESVQWFAEQMELKLQKHDSDYGKRGWLYPACTPEYLQDRLMDELNEMNIFGDDQVLIWECADVANFAMMIADQARVRLTKALEGKG